MSGRCTAERTDIAAAEETEEVAVERTEDVDEDLTDDIDEGRSRISTDDSAEEAVGAEEDVRSSLQRSSPNSTALRPALLTFTAVVGEGFHRRGWSRSPLTGVVYVR